MSNRHARSRPSVNVTPQMRLRLSLINLPSSTFALHPTHLFIRVVLLRFVLLMAANTSLSTKVVFAESVRFVKLGRTAVD